MIRAGLFLFSVLAFLSRPALGADPLKTVRAYCRADGLGDRLQPSTWINVAPLVAWKIEPAWDHLRLIRGYEMGAPQLTEDGVEVEVTYTVSGDLRADEVLREVRLEGRTYRLVTKDKGEHWRIVGPPPVPYLFESQAEVEALSDLLSADDSSYVSNSSFVWHTLKSKYPSLPYSATKSLATAPYLMETEEPGEGDVAIYFDGDLPFHAGVVGAEGMILSATMNAGVWRGPAESFPGTVRYFTVDAEKIAPVPESPPAPTADATPAVEDTPVAAPL